MNVTCPDCRSVFRVDPAKVPLGGVRARCSVCGGVIPVPAPDLAVAGAVAGVTPAGMVTAARGPTSPVVPVEGDVAAALFGPEAAAAPPIVEEALAVRAAPATPVLTPALTPAAAPRRATPIFTPPSPPPITAIPRPGVPPMPPPMPATGSPSTPRPFP
ncbi:MAG TPA: zinc-ribbon domain-containing protein, partial [Gemmatimonadaceae bacterium]|nr:zinc-ribbon domain-containing protein [Gemmatimonadaceae bacterium]